MHFYRYTHIQALLDIFIFQNPIQPVKFFEYYSEKLKENYPKLLLDPDLDFLNDIDFEISQKISDKYKVYYKIFYKKKFKKNIMRGFYF